MGCAASSSDGCWPDVEALTPAPMAATRQPSKQHHAADAFPGMHQAEALVDVGERYSVRDHGIDLNFLFHVPVDDPWHVRATPRPAEGSALPHAAGDQLKRACGDLLAGAGHTDDYAHAPAPVTGLQLLAHDRDVAGAVEGIVGAADWVGGPLRHIDDVGDEIATDLRRIDEVRHAEALTPRLLRRIDIDADDHVGTGESEPLDDIEANAAEAEHGTFGAGLHSGGVEHGADAGRHAAANVANLVEGRVLTDLGHRDLGQHRKVGKGRCAHIVEELLARQREAAGAIRHHALALGGADRGT